jgi:hypothetical protein
LSFDEKKPDLVTLMEKNIAGGINAMHIIIAMGEEPRNVEIPCMLFEDKQNAENYISKIPWLRCTSDDEIDNVGEPDPIAFYEVPKEIYDMPIPLRILATLPRDIMSDATLEINKNKITYGQAAGFCFFTDYNDRRDRVYRYWLREAKFGQMLAVFGDETLSCDVRKDY